MPANRIDSVSVGICFRNFRVGGIRAVFFNRRFELFETRAVHLLLLLYQPRLRSSMVSSGVGQWPVRLGLRYQHLGERNNPGSFDMADCFGPSP